MRHQSQLMDKKQHNVINSSTLDLLYKVIGIEEDILIEWIKLIEVERL